ncbi:DUF1289 domain-containing protein [Aliikangiella marina]|uniref:DUF1289 domain-containing protein n=1 Tax=Aliikangiella marina TaxID=1712262 RepID=A0A545T1N8_9GAMM|nr:DUF1289 domain-containing protein [Aliikangiella marina]
MQSPCISLCTLNENDICVGCYRHIDEITGWHSADDRRRTEILNNCATRKSDLTKSKHTL